MKEYKVNQLDYILDEGIRFKDGYCITFAECNYEWKREKQLAKSTCVGEYALGEKELYILFYSIGKIKLIFKGPFKKRRFVRLQKKLEALGYTLYSLS